MPSAHMSKIESIGKNLLYFQFKLTISFGIERKSFIKTLTKITNMANFCYYFQFWTYLAD